MGGDTTRCVLNSQGVTTHVAKKARPKKAVTSVIDT